MDFDPLSFFSPVVGKFEEISTFVAGDEPKETMIPPSTEKEEEDEEVSGASLIHVFDLPHLKPGLPRSVVLTILQLLKPEQMTNFGDVRDDSKTSLEILESKGISEEQMAATKQWLMDSGYTKLGRNLQDMSFSAGFFSYLNKIIACPLFINDEEILHEASMRISENCGRTARPNFQRKMLVKGMPEPILLNEPALTADSLGLKTWGSSLILSELLAQRHKELVLQEDHKVLELGAGTGLVGITLGLLGYDVLLTDLPEILANMETNVKLNKLGCECLVLDWTDPSSFLQLKGDDVKYKTIVVADPIYSSEHPRWVMNMIVKFLQKTPDSRALLQIAARKMFEQERANLWRFIAEEGFDVIEEEEMHGYDDFGAQRFIYKQIRWSDEKLKNA